MSRGDAWSVAVTLIVTGGVYFVRGKTAAGITLGLGLLIAIVLHMTRATKKGEKDNQLSELMMMWPDKWRELASDFSKLPNDTRADWYGQVGGDVPMVENQWSIAGGIQRENCEALCKLAGAMLLRSPKISSKLSEMVRLQTNEVRRWLYFLKEHSGVPKETLVGDGIAHGISVKTSMQSINGLATVSARVCIECSAEEI